MESVYAEQALRLYQELADSPVLYGLDCGASDKPEAVRLRQAWQPARWEWSSVDVNDVSAGIYTDKYKCRVGELTGETDFDFVLCVSVLEHWKQCEDDAESILGALHNALSDKGVIVLTVPVGVAMEFDDFEQFNAVELGGTLAERFHILDERFWLWNGDNWENCRAEDTEGAVYGMTNQARCAAAVGGWVLARKG